MTAIALGSSAPPLGTSLDPATPGQEQLLRAAAALPALRREPERDGVDGPYKLPDPVTGQPAKWTRVSTLKETLDETFALDRWKQRMVALGLSRRTDLVAAIAAVADPDDRPGRDIVNDACWKAMDTAGGNLGSALGTAMHTFTEHMDWAIANRTEPPRPPAPYDDDLGAYFVACQRAGIVRPADHIERIVVNSEMGVAGTLDRLVEVDQLGDIVIPPGELVVGDVKTQKTMDYGQVAIAIQLACYARAPYMWRTDGGGWEPMPAVNLDHALVFHMPVGTGTCVIHVVDIARGWELAKLALAVRAARRTKGLFTELSPAQPVARVAPRVGVVSMGTATRALATVVAEADAADAPRREALIAMATEALQQPKAADANCPQCHGLGATTIPPCSGCGASCGDQETWTDDELGEARMIADATAEITRRLRTLAATDAGRAALTDPANWPAGVPMAPPWTIEHLDALDELVTRLTPRSRTGLKPDDVGVVGPRLWPTPDNGGPISEDEALAVRALLEAGMAHPHINQQLTTWRLDARRVNKPFGDPTIREAAVVRAALACATHLYDKDDPKELLIRSTLAVVIKEDVVGNTDWPTGGVIGSLTTDEATRLTALAEAFAASDPTVVARLGAVVAAAPAAA